MSTDLAVLRIIDKKPIPLSMLSHVGSNVHLVAQLALSGLQTADDPDLANRHRAACREALAATADTVRAAREHYRQLTDTLTGTLREILALSSAKGVERLQRTRQLIDTLPPFDSEKASDAGLEGLLALWTTGKLPAKTANLPSDYSWHSETPSTIRALVRYRGAVIQADEQAGPCWRAITVVREWIDVNFGLILQLVDKPPTERALLPESYLRDTVLGLGRDPDAGEHVVAANERNEPLVRQALEWFEARDVWQSVRDADVIIDGLASAIEQEFAKLLPGVEHRSSARQAQERRNYAVALASTPWAQLSGQLSARSVQDRGSMLQAWASGVWLLPAEPRHRLFAALLEGAALRRTPLLLGFLRRERQDALHCEALSCILREGTSALAVSAHTPDDAQALVAMVLAAAWVMPAGLLHDLAYSPEWRAIVISALCTPERNDLPVMADAEVVRTMELAALGDKRALRRWSPKRVHRNLDSGRVPYPSTFLELVRAYRLMQEDLKGAPAV